MDKDSQHEWVCNFADFEAVLVCINDIQEWNRISIIRAFQTYLWFDASTPGNDQTFSHSETGVLVKYEGNVLAIEWGQGSLQEAFPDLFDVLYALGWRAATVYHPIETMNSLLLDMGRAIPARIDFDIKPADSVRVISEFAEGESLLERGRHVVQDGETAAANSIIFAELQSMNTVVPSTLNVFKLMDDDDDALGVEETVLVSEKLHGPAFASNDTVAPQMSPVFVLPEENGFDATPLTPLFSSVHSIVSAPSPKIVTVTEKKEVTHESEVKKQVQQVINEPHKINSAPAGLPNTEVFIDDSMYLGRVVKVGASTFCFDIPTDPMSDDEINIIANHCRSTGIVHLNPGNLNESMRWDFFGEMTIDSPWFVEKLVSFMNISKTNSVSVASMLLSLKRSRTKIDLRDTLMLAVSGSPELTDLLEFNQSQARQAMDEIVNCLSALSLCPTGQAFVDCSTDAENTTLNMFQLFTIREVAESSISQLFVVHVDRLDGCFIDWLAEILRNVAMCYGDSKRYSQTRYSYS